MATKSKATEPTATESEEAPKRKRGRPPKVREIDPETGQTIETKAKTVKHPVPDGFDVPAEFHAYLMYHGISDATQQAVYAWTRDAEAHDRSVTDKEGNTVIKHVESNGFPSTVHSDGRVIIDRAAAIEWIKSHEDAKRNRIAQARNRELNASTRMIAGVCRLTNLLWAAAMANKSDAATVAVSEEN